MRLSTHVSAGKWLALLVAALIYVIVEADTDFDYDWEHSAYPPFTGTRKSMAHTRRLIACILDLEGQMHHWNYRGLISSYSFIRLTNDEQSQLGYLFSKQPFEASDWFVDFQFEIVSSGKHHGDGMAFWFTEKEYQAGEAFGHDEMFKGLGVFFDTFRNGDHSVNSHAA